MNATWAPTVVLVVLAEREMVNGVVPTLISMKADPVEFPKESNTSTLAAYAPDLE